MLNNIIDEETKASNEFNNKPKNTDENLINKIYSSLIKFFALNPDNYNENLANTIIANLENQNKFELMFEIFNFNEKEVMYPTYFAIIEEFVFDELNKRFHNLLEYNYIKSEIIINEQNIIIKYNKHKNEEINYYPLLIGNIEDDMIFVLKYLINFSEEKNRKEIFETFIENNYDIVMKKYEKYFKHDYPNINKNFIKFNDIAMNFNENNIGDKIIKLFLNLYLFNDDIENAKKKTIKNNGKMFYYLINKKLMNIYKEYYEYEDLCKYFEKMKNNKLFNYNFKQLLESIKVKNEEDINIFISELIKDIPLETLKKLEDKKLDQKELITKLNDKSLSLNKITHKINNKNSFEFLGENVILTVELFDLLSNLETNNVIESLKSQIEKIECLIGENKLYIKSEAKIKNSESETIYYFLNIGYIKNNIFQPSLLVYYYDKDDLENNISFLNTNSFSEFVQHYNLINNYNCKLQNSENINIGEIWKVAPLSTEIENIIGTDNIIINDEAMAFLSLVLYMKKFNKEKGLPFKNDQKQLGYFVKIDFINEIKKLKIYKIIDEYITKNKNIQEIIDNNNDKSFDDLSYLVQKKFDTDINKEINNENIDSIYIYSFFYNVSLEYITINGNKYIYFANNFMLLDEEIYYLFRGMAWNENYYDYYLIGENKIFIQNDKEKYMLVYNIQENNSLTLELILTFDNNENSILERISENGYKYFVDNLLFTNEVSPLFELSGEKIGSCYKYSSTKGDYINDGINENICLDLRKIFILYMNYQKMELQTNKQNNKSFKEYYLVNKLWLQNYKKYYNFDTVYKEIEKNSAIKSVIKHLNEIKDSEDFISDMKVFLMLKSLPKDLVIKLIYQEKNFTTEYKNEQTKIPIVKPMEYLDNNQQINNLFYYDDFEIISSEIYKYLFEKIDTIIYTETKFFILKTGGIKNEAEKVLCLLDKNRIIIKLINNSINSDGKYVLYIGKLNSDYIFEIECFLLYDSIDLMEEHIEKVHESIGFDNFCEMFMDSKINVKELKIENKNYGLAIKKV